MVVPAGEPRTTGRRVPRVARIAAFIDETGDSFRAVRVLLAPLDALRPHLPGTLGNLEDIAIQPLWTRVLPAIWPFYPAANRDTVFLDSPWNALLPLGAGTALAGGHAGGKALTTIQAEEAHRAARGVVHLAWPATPPLTAEASFASILETVSGHPALLSFLPMPDERARPHRGFAAGALEGHAGKTLRTIRVLCAIAIRAIRKARMPGHETAKRGLTVRIRATVPLIRQQCSTYILGEHRKDMNLPRLWHGSRLHDHEEQTGHWKQEENGSQDPQEDVPSHESHGRAGRHRSSAQPAMQYQGSRGWWCPQVSPGPQASGVRGSQGL